MAYSLDTKIKDLVANKEIHDQLKEWFPTLVDSPAMDMVKGQSLKEAAYLAPSILTDEMLSKIADFLETVKD